jgi:AcrR family transcriptional regulator
MAGSGKALSVSAPEGIAASPNLQPGGRDGGRPEGHALDGASKQAGGLGPERVVEIQRARILAAMVEVSAERGAVNVSVAHIVERAGVSRRTFYELFADREQCFLAAFDQALERVAAVVAPAYEHGGSWSARVRASLAALLELFDHDPGMGRLLIVESLGAGRDALERRGNLLAQIIPIVDQGRAETRRSEGPPPLTAEGVLGGVLSVLHARLLARAPGGGPLDGRVASRENGKGFGGDEGGSLLALTGPLTGMVVLPYLGPAAARRELARPAPAPRGAPSPVPADPLRDVPMRLTYRTVRVLTAVAELGGRGMHPSNREVGLASGMHDQGQISKLLTRLSRLGLIENTGAGLARGAPNAWQLTPKGIEIEQAVGAGAVIER